MPVAGSWLNVAVNDMMGCKEDGDLGCPGLAKLPEDLAENCDILGESDADTLDEIKQIAINCTHHRKKACMVPYFLNVAKVAIPPSNEDRAE